MTPHEQAAYDLGAMAAKSAASWIFDGNTDRGRYALILSLMDDGDPRVEEYLPREPNLSGEYADDPTPHSLACDILGDWDDTEEDFAKIAALADAYEQGVSDTFMPECERILREAIAPEDTSEDPCTDHGFDVCPDCGNAGTKIGADGYEPCTRFLTCWSDPS